MQCLSCGNPLFNLKASRCPACRTRFDSRDFHFEPGTIAFACPMCGRHHIGQGPHHTLPEADIVRCLGCGAEVDPCTMAVVPLVDGAMGVPLRDEPVPWERGAELGRFHAWVITAATVCFRPGELGAQLSASSSVGWAFLFSGIVAMIATLLAGLTGGSLDACSGAFVFLFGPLFLIILAALPAHGVLRLTGPIRHAFPVTCIAVFYGQVPNILSAIPSPGDVLSYIGSIWALVATGRILMVSQGVDWLRAFASLLVVPVLVTVLLIALWTAGVFGSAKTDEAASYPQPIFVLPDQTE